MSTNAMSYRETAQLLYTEIKTIYDELGIACRESYKMAQMGDEEFGSMSCHFLCNLAEKLHDVAQSGTDTINYVCDVLADGAYAAIDMRNETMIADMLFDRLNMNSDVELESLNVTAVLNRVPRMIRSCRPYAIRVVDRTIGTDEMKEIWDYYLRVSRPDEEPESEEESFWDYIAKESAYIFMQESFAFRDANEAALEAAVG